MKREPITSHFATVWLQVVTFLILINTVRGQTFVVNNTLDSGPGSLRQAISDANVAGGTVLFSNVTGTVTLTSGELGINANVNVLGPGSTIVAVSVNSSNRVFTVNSGATASISGLTIQNGSTTNGLGGGLYNLGSLVLSNCVITGNSSHLNRMPLMLPTGGGIYNGGTLMMANCVVSNNFADAFSDGGLYSDGGLGGGIYNIGLLTLDSCVISSNWCADVLSDMGSSSPPCGGGIYNTHSLTINRCSISNNHAGKGNDTCCDDPPGGGGLGGGIFNSGTVTMSNSSVSGNSSGDGGSGVQYGFIGGSGGSGGGVWNNGSMYVTACTISSNFCGKGGDAGPYGISPLSGGVGGSGGGIYNSGYLALTNNTIAGNACGNGGKGSNGSINGPYVPGGGTGGSGGSGGGICSTGTFLSVCCTIYGNSAGIGGAGGNGIIYDRNGDGGNGGNGGSSGNGGGIFSGGTLSLWNCTISSNSAAQGGPAGLGAVGSGIPGTNGTLGAYGVGGGCANTNGTAQLLNTLIANDRAVGSSLDVSGSFTSLGHNLIGNTAGSSGFGASGDLLNVNPQLAPLGNNGGPTLTCALPVTSPAIDAGDDAVLSSPYNLVADERGLPRKSGLHVDIGAFEFQPPFAIVSLVRQGHDMQITWSTWGGLSYVLQSTETAAGGGYSSNFFLDVSPVIATPGVGPSTTNYVDVGALNAPVLTLPTSQMTSTSGAPSSVTTAAAYTRGLADDMGNPIPIGSVLMLGTFNISEATIQSNFNAGNLSAIMSAFTPYTNAFAVGDGTSVPASWDVTRSAAGLAGQHIYLLAVDKPIWTSATQLGIFTAPSWVFPGNGSATSIDLQDVTDFVIGAHGGPLTVNLPLGGQTYTFTDSAQLSVLPGRIRFYRVRLVP